MNLTAAADPLKQECNHRPHTAKELAGKFGVSLGYVYAMRNAGAPFWGRVSTVAALLEWWGQNPSFTKGQPRKSNAMGQVLPIKEPVRVVKRSGRNGTLYVV